MIGQSLHKAYLARVTLSLWQMKRLACRPSAIDVSTWRHKQSASLFKCAARLLQTEGATVDEDERDLPSSQRQWEAEESLQEKTCPGRGAYAGPPDRGNPRSKSQRFFHPSCSESLCPGPLHAFFRPTIYTGELFTLHDSEYSAVYSHLPQS